MVGSFGVVPVAGLIAAAQGASPVVGVSALATPARPLQLVDGAGLRSVMLSGSPTVEVILGLEGRSLAAEQAYRTSIGLAPFDAAGQRAYVASLAAAQAPVIAALKAAGATVRYQYRLTYDGLDVIGGRVALTQVIARLPGVQRIDLAQQANLDLDASVPFIFDDATYAQLGGDGTGVTIALIDTGIDYTHATFGGPGTVAAYEAIDPTTLAGSGFPTAKVIGGYDLVGENYDARGATAPGGTCSAIPIPDPNPLDINGHGTHTASTAAGEEVRDGEGNLLTPHGVAPGASILEYKVFSGCAADGTASTSNANVIAAIERAVDPDQNGDTSDHANVISLSLGSDFGRDTTPDSVAANAAVDLGSIVVASAGNAGNVPYITGSPATASKVISVAAGNDPKIFVQLVTVAGSNGKDGNYESVEAAITPPLTTVGTVSGPTVYGGLACSPSPFATSSLNGMIPLISRGTCTFAEKILNAQAAGAIGVVVMNNVAGDPIIMGGVSTGITIPAVMVSVADGLAIRGALTPTTTFTLDPTNRLYIPNRLAAFTSAGPRFGDSAIKPDLTAPGVEILSAEVGTGTESTPVSGTSFSAPHVAGAAAILKELHPDWLPEEIKAVLMNTATDTSRKGVLYPISLMGAGRIRVDLAAAATSVAVPGSLSFGVVEGTTAGPTTYSETLDVRNKEGGDKTFSVAAALTFNRDAKGGITMLYPTSLDVPAGGDAELTFSLNVDFSKIAAGTLNQYAGFVTLTDTTGADVLRVPFEVIPIARSAATAAVTSGTTISFSNPGVAGTGVDLFQLGVTSHHTDVLPGEDGDWLTIKATGARTYGSLAVSSHPAQVLEFAVATWGLRSAPSDVVTDIFISVDGATPQYVVEVADYGLYTTGSYVGQMVSGVFVTQPYPGAAATGFLEYFVDSSRNTAWQTAPILLADLNTLARENHLPKIGLDNHAFTYTVVMTDLQTGYADIAGPGSFNAKMPAVDAVPNSFVLGPDSAATAQVVGMGSLLALFENNVAGMDQSLVISG